MWALLRRSTPNKVIDYADFNPITSFNSAPIPTTSLGRLALRRQSSKFTPFDACNSVSSRVAIATDHYGASRRKLGMLEQNRDDGRARQLTQVNFSSCATPQWLLQVEFHLPAKVFLRLPSRKAMRGPNQHQGCQQHSTSSTSWADHVRGIHAIYLSAY